MYTSLLFAALAALPLLISAIPTPSTLNRRSCSIMLPTSYQQISQASPSQAFPQGRSFLVSQQAGGTNDIDTLVSFTGIPSGSYGCQLAMSFTYNYPIIAPGFPLVNVYAIPSSAHNISSSDTYTTYFSSGGRGLPQIPGSYLFGSVHIDGSKGVVNSQVCSPDLNYLFEITSDTDAGTTSFTDAGNNLSGIGGFYVTYDC